MPTHPVPGTGWPWPPSASCLYRSPPAHPAASSHTPSAPPPSARSTSCLELQEGHNNTEHEVIFRSTSSVSFSSALDTATAMCGYTVTVNTQTGNMRREGIWWLHGLCLKEADQQQLWGYICLSLLLSNIYHELVILWL